MRYPVRRSGYPALSRTSAPGALLSAFGEEPFAHPVETPDASAAGFGRRSARSAPSRSVPATVERRSPPRARPRQSRPNCNPAVAGIGEIHPKTLAISANAVGFSLPMVYPSGGTRRWTAWQFFYTISSDGSSLWLFKPSSKTPIASAFERKVALGCERSVKTLV